MIDPERRIRVLSPLFWVAMIFCLLCFAGAGFIALTAVRPHPSSAALGLHPRPR